LVKLNFDVVAFEVLRRAESDPEAAAEAMRIAARYLRDERPLPMGLGDWLANALDDAALKPAPYRAKALTEALHLTAKNRRPAGDWLLLGSEFDVRMRPGSTINSVAADIAALYDIDARTAKRYWRRYQKAKEEHDATE
jgi:hypothetical protein